MVRRKGTNLVAVILILLAVSMTACGAYMSFSGVEMIPIDDDGDTTTDVITTTEPVYTDNTRPIRWDLEFANIFGGDGQFDLWNAMLFIGLALFVVGFLMMRR